MKSSRRELLVAKGWIQGIAIVVCFGFFILGLLAYRTYTDEPPIPSKVLDPSGQTLFTQHDVSEGQQVFLRNGLMEYGSILGHGAYLGPDYTADYLHRAALIVLAKYGGPSSDQARAKAIADFTGNRYDKRSGVLTFSAAQAEAFHQLQAEYYKFFAEPTSKYGLRPAAISDVHEVNQLVAFFCWSAWTASAPRPGYNYSYTNNWPPEPLVDNHVTADAVVWSVLSLITLLGGIGILLAAFGRWSLLGWHGREQRTISFRSPDEVTLAPAQRSCSWFFFVMSLLFLLQAMLGGATQHYRADLTNFFGPSSYSPSKCGHWHFPDTQAALLKASKEKDMGAYQNFEANTAFSAS